MAQHVQELIEKIKTEGIAQSEQRAKEIEQKARQSAEAIVAEARARADQILRDAEAETKRMRESTQVTLQQAARDMLLKVRREIEAALTAIMESDVHKALTPEELAALITKVAEGYLKENAGVKDITVTLSPHDLKKLAEGFQAKLKARLKHPLVCRSADDVSGGFTISFDQSKSCFDFTDKSLVECLAGTVNQEIAALLKEATQQ